MSIERTMPRHDFDLLARGALALGASLVFTSCAGEPTETPIARAAAVRSKAAASADDARATTGAFCPDPSSYFIEVNGADAGPVILRSSCANATGDFGAVGAFGGPFAHYSSSTRPTVLLEACSDRSRDAAKISIVFGSKDSGSSVYFRDALGTVFLSFSQDVSDSNLQIGPLGGTIEGRYLTTLYTAKPGGFGQDDGPIISGSFRVCHLQDVDLTPVK